eukprot:CAMPEP_0117427314 /NCGR_PEP_ID=MMETSP0758-20121206/7189_1 /TAXON_ID=63605 /ORGANISM="Percolomonas cosmopolitus, Strain AE-1 (ATCC 50343)" /LENGTH=30 /DNA_ID= /DNA_START= /DNA_END= /DNA_ORIENTATION=
MQKKKHQNIETLKQHNDPDQKKNDESQKKN